MNFIIFILNFINLSVTSEFDAVQTDVRSLFDALLPNLNVHKFLLLNENPIDPRFAPINVFITKECFKRYPTENFNRRFLNKIGKSPTALFESSSILCVAVLETEQLRHPQREASLVKVLQSISVASVRSKFLLFAISSKPGSSFEFLLKHAWAKEILDIAVFEIISQSEQPTPRTSHLVHQFNPFRNAYQQQPYDSGVRLFPKRTGDLHGYELRIGLVNYPPFAHMIPRTSDSEQVIDGEDGRLIRTIAESMNFTIAPVIRPIERYGLIFANGTGTELLGDIQSGKLDVIAHGAFNFGTMTRTTWREDRSTFIRNEEFCALVPVYPTTEFSGLVSFYQSILVLLVVLVPVCAFGALLLKSEPGLWDPLNIAFVILGVSVHKQPSYTRERWVFGSCLVLSFFYSSTFIAQMTSFNVNTKAYKTFDSFQELYSSKLVPVIHPNLFNMTFRYDGVDKYLARLGRKSIARPDGPQFCHEWLLTKRNVTCIMEKMRAEFLIMSNKNAKGEDAMMVAPLHFWRATKTFILRKSSPYTDQFNQIILRAKQADIKRRWWLEYYNKFSADFHLKSEDQAKVEEESILIDMYVIGVFGYLLSACVFFMEIVASRLRKSFSRRRFFKGTLPIAKRSLSIDVLAYNWRATRAE